MVAFSSSARILRECSTIHSPPALFFFYAHRAVMSSCSLLWMLTSNKLIVLTSQSHAAIVTSAGLMTDRKMMSLTWNHEWWNKNCHSDSTSITWIEICQLAEKIMICPIRQVTEIFYSTAQHSKLPAPGSQAVLIVLHWVQKKKIFLTTCTLILYIIHTN